MESGYRLLLDFRPLIQGTQTKHYFKNNRAWKGCIGSLMWGHQNPRDPRVPEHANAVVLFFGASNGASFRTDDRAEAGAATVGFEAPWKWTQGVQGRHY